MRMVAGERTVKTFPFDRLSLFSFLWAIATLFHSISFYDDINLGNPLTWLDLAAAVALIAYPRSVILFLLLLCFRIAHVAEWMPFTPNHILFEFILNIGILLLLLWTLLASYLKNAGLNTQDPETRNKLFNAFAPVARVSLFILYFYAVLHKLNWDYLNPAISCSTILMEGVIESRLHFLPSNEWIHLAAVWSTLLLEAGIPTLLFFNRTRSLGILLGMGFHYFLSIHPHGGIYSFSAMLFALFFLFTSPNFPKKLSILIGMLLKGWQNIRRSGKLILVFAGLSVAGFVLVHWRYRLDIAGFLFWSIWALVVMFIYASISILTPKVRVTDYQQTFGMQQAWFWLVPLIILFNGMSPYLGFKTQTSFSMFSNLRTEGGITNHIFIPSSLQLTGWQKDLVEVEESDFESLSRIHGENQYIPFFEFQRIVSQTKEDFYVKYWRNGKLKELKVEGGISSKPKLTDSIVGFAAKVLYFRPVDKGPCGCKH